MPSDPSDPFGAAKLHGSLRQVAENNQAAFRQFTERWRPRALDGIGPAHPDDLADPSVFATLIDQIGQGADRLDNLVRAIDGPETPAVTRAEARRALPQACVNLGSLIQPSQLGLLAHHAHESSTFGDACRMLVCEYVAHQNEPISMGAFLAFARGFSRTAKDHLPTIRAEWTARQAVAHEPEMPVAKAPPKKKRRGKGKTKDLITGMLDALIDNGQWGKTHAEIYTAVGVPKSTYSHLQKHDMAVAAKIQEYERRSLGREPTRPQDY